MSYGKCGVKQRCWRTHLLQLYVILIYYVSMTLEVMFNLYDMTPLICFVITMNNKVHFCIFYYLLNMDELIRWDQSEDFNELLRINWGQSSFILFTELYICVGSW